MTTEQARRLLGKEANGLSEEELQRDIDAAELLTNIFFSFHHAERIEPKLISYKFSNVP